MFKCFIFCDLYHCSACAFDMCLLNYLLTYLLTCFVSKAVKNHKQQMDPSVQILATVRISCLPSKPKQLLLIINVRFLPVNRCATISVSVTVKKDSLLLTAPSLEAEAVCIATQPRSIRRVSSLHVDKQHVARTLRKS